MQMTERKTALWKLILSLPILLPLTAWSAACLWIDGPASRVPAGLLAGGGIAYLGVQDGYTSLEKFSEAQNVTLSYNDAGELVDRGTTEGAQAILTLLQDDWGYSVDFDELDPNDPIVNTDTEYMYQMATIGYHVLHGLSSENVTGPSLPCRP